MTGYPFTSPLRVRATPRHEASTRQGVEATGIDRMFPPTYRPTAFVLPTESMLTCVRPQCRPRADAEPGTRPFWVPEAPRDVDHDPDENARMADPNRCGGRWRVLGRQS
jgi:hypothetical protein